MHAHLANPNARYLGAVHACAAASATIGAIVLFGGWGLKIAFLRNPIPGYTDMKANTAAGLLLASCALWGVRAKTPRFRLLCVVCATLVLLLGSLILMEDVSGHKFGIDELLFRDMAAGTTNPGRPSPVTAAAFVLLGGSLLLAASKLRGRVAQTLSLIVGLIGLVNLVGRLYGVQDLVIVTAQAPMAVHTAAAMLLLAAGILLSQPDRGLVAAMTSSGPGGILARRLLPAAIFVPAFLGWLRWQGQLHGLYGSGYGLALFASSNIVVLTILIRMTAGILDRLDAKRSGAEDRLRQSEANFRQLAEALPQIVWTAGPDGNFEYFNQRWWDYTGAHPREGADLGWRSATHPDDLDKSIQSWHRSLETGELYENERRFLRASDGTYRWHLGRALPIRDSRGEIVRWFGTCTDIEDYKSAEAAIKSLNEALEQRVQGRTVELESAYNELVQTRARLQAILDSATHVSIIATDDNGIIRLFNSGAEKMLQYLADEMVGIRTPEIIHHLPEVMERSAELSRELGRPVEGFDVLVTEARQGGSAEKEWTYVRKDGTTLDVRLAVTAVKGPNGAPDGFLGVGTDITPLKALERDLRLNNDRLAEQTRRAEEANRAKSEFLASMSHEIRTPMNSILGMADLLWDTELGPDQRQYVEVFRRAGTNLLALINDILDVSKIEAGHFELEHIEFDLEELTDETIGLIAPKARAKGIGLHGRVAPGTPASLIGDPTRIRQVLINLLGNAVKFTDAGEVVLSVSGNDSSRPGHVAFAVSDTGVGIPAEKLETIFDDFAQADSSTTRKYGGTGLGLAISRRIVEKMGGRIWVTSSPGQGSTFCFSASFQPGLESRRATPAGVKDLYGKQVLLVDNSLINLLILRETLSAWGVAADECQSGEAAVRALAERPYDAVLLDDRMPGMSGFELAGVIRQTHPRTPVIMLTSDNKPGDLNRSKQLGLAGYAIKPVKRSELLRLLCSALNTNAGESPREVEGPAEPGNSTRSLKILAAEDVPDNRLLLQGYLKGSPHHVSFVEDGKAAVESFAGGGFDLVLMDMHMPIMDGLTATRQIRALEAAHKAPPIPILALTASARPEDAEASRQAGCTAHLAKPISKQRLLKALEEHGRMAPAPRVAELSAAETPDWLQALIPDYLDARRSEVAGMMALLTASDFDRLRVLGHNFKGNGTPYGFPELSKLGAELEAAAKRADSTAIARHVADLDNYLTSVANGAQA
jgi:PAS domain S-box-containing protein